MPRQREKKAFLFRASTLDILQELPEERQGKIAMAIIEYGLDYNCFFTEGADIQYILSSTEHILFDSVLYDINVQKRRHYNKYLIHGAIVMIQTAIVQCESKVEGDEKRNEYIDLINILEERYQDVTEHDERDLPGELSTLLPRTIRDSFWRTYQVKYIGDYIKEILEKRLKRESRNLSEDAKTDLVKKLLADYLETDSVFGRYEELIQQYSENIQEGNNNETR